MQILMNANGPGPRHSATKLFSHITVPRITVHHIIIRRTTPSFCMLGRWWPFLLRSERTNKCIYCNWAVFCYCSIYVFASLKNRQKSILHLWPKYFREKKMVRNSSEQLKCSSYSDFPQFKEGHKASEHCPIWGCKIILLTESSIFVNEIGYIQSSLFLARPADILNSKYLCK